MTIIITPGGVVMYLTDLLVCTKNAALIAQAAFFIFSKAIDY